MTSLIDVIFLLLLFFMLSSTFSRFAEVELSAAAAGTGSADAPPLFLRLEPDSLSLNGETMSLADLAMALAQPDDATAPQRLLVSLSGQVTSQRLTDCLGALRGVPGIAPTILGAG